MKKTFLYALAFIALGLGSGSLGPTLPTLAAQTHAEMHQISNVFLARSFGTMLGAWWVGRWYDRVAGHPLLALSLLASAAALALFPAMSLLWMLLALSLFFGLASASINVGGNALIVQVHGERVRPFMSTLHFAFGLGGCLAPLLFAKLVTRADATQLLYWTLALATLPVVALTIFARSPQVQARQEKTALAPLPIATLALFALYFFLEVGAEASVMGWYYTYASNRGADKQTASYLNSGFWAAFTLGRLATIWTSTRFKAIHLVLVHLCLTLLVAISLLLLPASPMTLWLGAIGLGLFVAPVFPSTFGFAQQILGLSGKVTGIFLVGSSAGGMFWPWLIGQFFAAQGPQILPWIAVFDLTAALAVILYLVSHTNTRKETHTDATPLLANAD